MSKPLPLPCLSLDGTRPRTNSTSHQAGSGSDAKVAFHEPGKWTPDEVVLWMRGVEKMLRPEQLEAFLDDNFDGQRLLSITEEELTKFGVTSIGCQQSILMAVEALKGLNSYLSHSPVAILGTSLLQAGRTIDERPLEAMAEMTEALTNTLAALDKKPPDDQFKYAHLRAFLLEHTAIFFDAVAEIGLRDTKSLTKLAKEYVRKLLPSLQQLRAITGDTAAKTSTAGSGTASTHVVSVSKAPDTALGISIKMNESGIVFISAIQPGGAAHKCGLLRLGDEIIEINNQTIVYWRLRSVSTFLKQCESPINFSIKMPADEFESRISALMRQARKIRQSMVHHGTRSSRATVKGREPRKSGLANSESAAGNSASDDAKDSETAAQTAAAAQPRGSSSMVPTSATASARNSSADVAAQHEQQQQQDNRPLATPDLSPIANRPSSPGSPPAEASKKSGSGQSPRIMPPGSPLKGQAKRPEISVILPAMREQVPLGKTRDIKWTSTNLSSTRGVTLRLENKEQGLSSVIAAGVPNTGAYQWQVPNAGLEARAGYRISILLPARDGNPTPELVATSDQFALVTSRGSSDNIFSSKKVEPKLVTLKAENASYGLETEGQFVSRIMDHGSAARNGKLRVGDVIVDINGTAVQGMSHISVLCLAHSREDEVQMIAVPHPRGFSNYLARMDSLRTTYSADMLGTQTIKLPGQKNGTAGLGIVLANADGITKVGDVLPGSLSDGVLAVNMVIMQVNGHSVDGAKAQEVSHFIDLVADQPLELTVSPFPNVCADYFSSVQRIRRECTFHPDVCADARRIGRRQSAKAKSKSRPMYTRKEPPMLTNEPKKKRSSLELLQRLGRKRSQTVSSGNSGNFGPGGGSSESLRDRSASVSMSRVPKDEQTSFARERATPCAALINPDIEGWLTKQGGSGFTPKNWRRRWFVLKNGLCLYYSSPSDLEALGVFKLPGTMVMPADTRKKYYNRFGFRVVPEEAPKKNKKGKESKKKSRVYHLCADSEAEMKKWMQAMALSSIKLTKSMREKEEESRFESACERAKMRAGENGSSIGGDSRKSMNSARGSVASDFHTGGISMC